MSVDSLQKFGEHMIELKSLEQKMNDLKADVKSEIENLPDNDKIERISKRAFTISSSALFGDPINNPTVRMDAFFHNFQLQYEQISSKIDTLPVQDITQYLTNIIKTGKDSKKNSYHPQVIEHLSNLLKRNGLLEESV